MLDSHGIASFFTHTRHLPALREHVADCRAAGAADERLFRFRSTNQALEWCEDELVVEGVDFLRLQESHPRIHAAVLRNIAASLAAKLRRASHHVSALSPQMG